jgi:hypothetical protein
LSIKNKKEDHEMANEFINLYKDNPTEGFNDGTLVSLGTDLSSLIEETVNASESETKKIKVALRCENGFNTTGDVSVWFVGDNADKWAVGATEDGEFSDVLTITDTIGNSNKVFYLSVTAQNGEVPSVDTSTKIRVKATIAATV